MIRFPLPHPTLVWAWRAVVCVIVLVGALRGDLLALSLGLISAAGAFTVEARP